MHQTKSRRRCCSKSHLYTAILISQSRRHHYATYDEMVFMRTTWRPSSPATTPHGADGASLEIQYMGAILRRSPTPCWPSPEDAADLVRHHHARRVPGPSDHGPESHRTLAAMMSSYSARSRDAIESAALGPETPTL
jgi:hypothetical protein